MSAHTPGQVSLRLRLKTTAFLLDRCRLSFRIYAAKPAMPAFSVLSKKISRFHCLTETAIFHVEVQCRVRVTSGLMHTCVRTIVRARADHNQDVGLLVGLLSIIPDVYSEAMAGQVLARRWEEDIYVRTACRLKPQGKSVPSMRLRRHCFNRPNATSQAC